MKSAVVIGVIVLLVIVGGFMLMRTSLDENISLPTPERPLIVVSPSITTVNKTSSNNAEEVSMQGDVGNSAASLPAVHEITLDAKRFTFVPAAIKVKEGENVKITVRNIDTTHGIFIPEFNARGKESLEFTATKKGNFPFYCATYCGSGHPDMQGTLIVE